MILKNLSLYNFRNYSSGHFGLNPNFNFIFGNNGEGKTNILESISYITFGKSFLNSSETDCVKFGEKMFDIKGVFENSAETEYYINLSYDFEAKKKSFYLNKEKITKSAVDIFGMFPIVFLSPHSLEITYGNPSERRKFFDILLSQTNRVYFDLLRKYTRILKQKNALLRGQITGSPMQGKDFRNLLTSINEKFIEYAIDIIFRRIDMLKFFMPVFEKSYKQLITGNDVPEIKYYSASLEQKSVNENYTYNEIKNIFTESILKINQEEINRGMSLAGPHRDDYIFCMCKESAGTGKFFSIKNFASQGEHKTFVIALKLAEFHFLKDITGKSPLLLLDDLLSELDNTRVSGIISQLKKYGQIFLTTTDKHYLKELNSFYNTDEISVFEIENGCIKN